MPDDSIKELNLEQNKNQTYMEIFKKKLDYTKLSKTIVQDLINNRKESVLFKRYSKEEVIKFLSDPQRYEKQIRDMSNFLYANSSHYKRLCNYFSKLCTLNYLLVPYNLNPNKYNKSSFLTNYRKVATQLEKFNLQYHLYRIMNICMYQDAFYGLWYETDNSFDIIQINADYCKISYKIDGCLTYSLNFDFFKTREYLLDTYGEEIKQMYLNYVGYTIENRDGKKKKVKGDSKLQWQVPPNQICLKINEDQLLYSLPPFAGIFPEILNLEDYKLLKKTGEILNHYKILAMNIPLNEDGGFKLDGKIAEEFYKQASNNIDDSIGLILTPMQVEKFDFSNSKVADSDAVNEAEGELWASSGSNGALFGFGDKLSSSSLNISIKNDESIAFALVKQAENWINKYIKGLGLPYEFRVSFLNQSIYSEDEVCDRMQRAASYGVAGAKSLYVASIGLSPSDVIGLTELENSLDFTNSWIPLKSSNTQSNKIDGEVGRPQQSKVQDSGEATRENDGNKNR